MSIQISKARNHAFHNQGGRCYYCGSPMWQGDVKNFAGKYRISDSAAARFQCTAEHLKPRCEGGGNDENNIVAACIFCNNNRHRRKVAPVPRRYKADIRKRIEKGKWHPKGLHLSAFHFV